MYGLIHQPLMHGSVSAILDTVHYACLHAVAAADTRQLRKENGNNVKLTSKLKYERPTSNVLLLQTAATTNITCMIELGAMPAERVATVPSSH
jgi:hypothetical protein